MQYEYILMAIPIILVVALIVVIAKRMTDGSGDGLDMKGAVLGTVIIAVGILIMVPIIGSVDPIYDYDSDNKTLTIYKNITGTELSWGNAANAESLVIEDTVTTISAGAFASLSDLEYISIPDSLETIGEGAFPTLKDYLDQTITEPEAGEYVGTGDGTLYYCDCSIYTYSTDSKSITGLASEASAAVNLVLPSKHNGTTITEIGASAFEGNTTIAMSMPLPDCEIASIGNAAFRQCTSLTGMSMASVTSIGNTAFSGCTSMTTAEFESVTSIGSGAFVSAAMTSIDFPELASLGWGAFRSNTALASASLPSMTTLASSMFDGCTALAEIDLSKITSIEGSCFRNTSLTEIDLSSIESLGNSVFTGVTTVTAVTFGSGLNSLGTTIFPWTFYDSDGTTELDKTVASNLAGYTFQGTASALVKVLPDRSALTTEQTLQVTELTEAAVKQVKLEESELQISEKAELAEA